MASSLTPAERLERQRTDQRMMAALDAADCPVHVTGHRSAADARTARDPLPPGGDGPPSHYRVVYDYDTLRAPGERHRPTVVHIAPLANGDYPSAPPSAWVVGEVVPWTPHFAANVPICHGGHAWIPNRTQLVDYAIHIGKLLNFDEPPPVPGYHGYNRQAVAYWRSKMRLRPLDADLRFPAIRAEDVLRVGAFAPAASDRAPAAGRFRAAGGAGPAGGRFHRAAAAAQGAGRFSPAGSGR